MNIPRLKDKDYKRIKENLVKSGLKILIADIECSKYLTKVYDRTPNFISHDNFDIESFHLFGISWKWLGDKTSQGFYAQHTKSYKEFTKLRKRLNTTIKDFVKEDKPKFLNKESIGLLNNFNDVEIFEKAWELLNDADIVVGHNFKAFDMKVLNDGFMKHHMVLPKQPRIDDSFYMSKSNKRGLCHKLDYVSQRFFKTGKLNEINNDVHNAAMEGCPKALNIMCRYGNGDIDLTEDYFIRALPYSKSIPKNIISPNDSCPVCTKKLNQVTYTTVQGITRTYNYARCSCGSLLRDKGTLRDKDVRQTTIVQAHSSIT